MILNVFTQSRNTQTEPYNAYHPLAQNRSSLLGSQPINDNYSSLHYSSPRQPISNQNVPLSVNNRYIDARHLYEEYEVESVEQAECGCFCKLMWLLIIFVIIAPLLIVFPFSALHGSNYCDTDKDVIDAYNISNCIPCPSNADYCMAGMLTIFV